MFPWNLFPFNKDSKNKLNKMKSEDIQNYVQEMMNKMMPAHLQGMNIQDMLKQTTTASSPLNQSTEMESTTKFNYIVFETHDFVYVRIPITEEQWLEQIKIFYTSNQLIIEHIPEINDKHTITLPSIVKRKGSSAQYKEGVLEVKIQKNIDIQYSQIDVTDFM